MVVRHIANTECFGALGFLNRLLSGKPSTYLPEPTSKLHKALEKVEAALEASAGPYVCGDKLCYGDVALFAILREILEYACFDKPSLLASRPKTSGLLTDLEGRSAQYMEQRVREQQLGIRSTVAFLAATNTPFPWSKKTKKREAGREVYSQM